MSSSPTSIPTHLDPNVRTKDGLTPLHFAASRLTQGSDTVMEAASTQSPGRLIIQMLLQANGSSQVIDVMAKDNQGITPLHMACARGNEPAVQELLNVPGMHLYSAYVSHICEGG